MPEDVTRDSALGKLARFQPSATGIDRDAMLFAAGRASARLRRWKALAGLLAILQLGTACAWLIVTHTGQPAQVAAPTSSPRTDLSEPMSPVEPMSPASYGGLAKWRDRDELPATPTLDDPAPSGPTLTIGSSQRVLSVD
jgi:hypothetical protein